jgi:hypothetical protein
LAPLVVSSVEATAPETHAVVETRNGTTVARRAVFLVPAVVIGVVKLRSIVAAGIGTTYATNKA